MQLLQLSTRTLITIIFSIKDNQQYYIAYPQVLKLHECIFLSSHTVYFSREIQLYKI